MSDVGCDAQQSPRVATCSVERRGAAVWPCPRSDRRLGPRRGDHRRAAPPLRVLRHDGRRVRRRRRPPRRRLCAGRRPRDRRGRSSAPDPLRAGSELSRLNADPRDAVPASDLLRTFAAAVRWAGDASGRARRRDLPRRGRGGRLPRALRPRPRRAPAPRPPRLAAARRVAAGRRARRRGRPAGRRPARQRRARQGPGRRPHGRRPRALRLVGRRLRGRPAPRRHRRPAAPGRRPRPVRRRARRAPLPPRPRCRGDERRRPAGAGPAATTSSTRGRARRPTPASCR